MSESCARAARRGLGIEGAVLNFLPFRPLHGTPRQSAEEPGEQRVTATLQSRPRQHTSPYLRCWKRFRTTPDQCPSHRVHQFKPHLRTLAKACFNVLGCLAASQTCAPILPPRRHFLRKYLRKRVRWRGIPGPVAGLLPDDGMGSRMLARLALGRLTLFCT